MRDSELAAFQRLRRKGRTIRAHAQRIEELEAQVMRLQDTIMALGTWISPSWDEDMDRREATLIIQKHYTQGTLRWGDLDPVANAKGVEQ